MNTVVIGLGSMGKRRIRLLKQYIDKHNNENESWNIFGVDSNQDRREEVKNLYQIGTYGSLKNALEDKRIDCAIIATSPQTHAKLVSECLKSNLHVFTELNLVDDGYEENIALAKECRKVLFMSSTFLYRKEIQYLKNLNMRERQGTYHYHVGQYLPEWHPWESYKDFFVDEKRTNACRELLAIELPWLVDTFGDIISIQVTHKKVSKLELDYDDTYQIILEHESGIMGNLAVDVVTPKAGREFEIWGEGFYVEWKGTPQTLKSYDSTEKVLQDVNLYDTVQHLEGYNQFVVENAYYDELANYIAVIKNQEEPRYSYEKDKKILALIDRIEE